MGFIFLSQKETRLPLATAEAFQHSFYLGYKQNPEFCQEYLLRRSRQSKEKKDDSFVVTPTTVIIAEKNLKLDRELKSLGQGISHAKQAWCPVIDLI